MSHRPGVFAALAAAAVTVALWLGAAMPGLATASEPPSPPALGAPARCAPPHDRVGVCPVVRSSAAMALTAPGRRLPAGQPGSAVALVVVTAASAVGLLTWRRSLRPVVGLAGARAPPVSAS